MKTKLLRKLRKQFKLYFDVYLNSYAFAMYEFDGVDKYEWYIKLLHPDFEVVLNRYHVELERVLDDYRRKNSLEIQIIP